MTEQEDPAQQEIERLARGEATELTDETNVAAADHRLDTGTAEDGPSTAGDSDNPSETVRKDMPGYQ